MEDEFEIEFSALCRRLERNGRSVQVDIYRGKDRDEDWVLEIVDQDTGSSIVWDELFRSDSEALDALLAEVAEQGLDKVIDDAHEVQLPR